MSTNENTIKNDDFPYYDDNIVFSENIPDALKKRLAKLKDAWQRKDIVYFSCIMPTVLNPCSNKVCI